MTYYTYGPVAAVFLSVGLLTEGCMSNAAPSEASLTGTATYRERIALPPGAVFEATLEDVSRADAPAEVLGRTQMESPVIHRSSSRSPMTPRASTRPTGTRCGRRSRTRTGSCSPPTPPIRC